MIKKKFIKNKNFIRVDLIKNYRLNLKLKIQRKWLEEQKKIKHEQNVTKNVIGFAKKNKAPLFLDNYYFLLQCLIKKGKKYSLELSFKKSLMFWIKYFPNKNFLEIINKAFKHTVLHVGVRAKRKGSKNIYIPYKLPTKKGRFLASKWILTNALAKKKRKFYEGILEELLECSLKTSNSIKKREEFLKLAEENLNNLKKIK